MTCHFCRLTHHGDHPWDRLHHPLAFIGSTSHCCPDCITRVLSAWDRLVSEVRRDALMETLILDRTTGPRREW